MRNSLIIPILQLLKENNAGISEYELIQTLEKQDFQFPHDDSNELALFKKHFIVMNALYTLQNELIPDGYFLSITSLSIKMDEIKQTSNSDELIDYTDTRLSEYYLNWDNYENTSKQDVNDLLNGFWDRFYSLDKKTQALGVFELELDASFDDVKLAYRRLVLLHHPDKGGGQDRFIEIREAYEVLKCCF